MPYKIPASIRKEILEKVFKEGVESVSKESLAKLFKGKSLRGKVFRRELNPKELLEKGFQTAYVKDPELIKKYPNSVLETGLYWSPTPEGVVAHTGRTPNVVGIQRPGRTYKSKDTTADFQYGMSDELVQHKPNNVLAQIRIGKKNFYRILGLTGALGGTMLGTEESEASPIGKIIKSGTKVAKTALKEAPSRTSTLLKGSEFMGQTIKKVTKGRGNWRHVVLEDGTVYPVTKDVASDLVRHKGTTEKMTEFGFRHPTRSSAVMGQVSQIDQALKSLAYHETRSNPYLPKRTIIENYKAYLGQVKSAGLGEAVPYSLVKRGGKLFTMPAAYADLLEKEGHLQIVKELK